MFWKNFQEPWIKGSIFFEPEVTVIDDSSILNCICLSKTAKKGYLDIHSFFVGLELASCEDHESYTPKK